MYLINKKEEKFKIIFKIFEFLLKRFFLKKKKLFKFKLLNS